MYVYQFSSGQFHVLVRALVLMWRSSFFIRVPMHSLIQANDRRNSSTNPSKLNHLDLYLPISFSIMVSSFHTPRHTSRSPKENSSQRRPCLGSNPQVATKNEYRSNVSSTQVGLFLPPVRLWQLTGILENDVGKAASNLSAIQKAFKDGYSSLLQLTPIDRNVLGPIVSVKQEVRKLSSFFLVDLRCYKMIFHRAYIADMVNNGRMGSNTAPPAVDQRLPYGPRTSGPRPPSAPRGMLSGRPKSKSQASGFGNSPAPRPGQS